MPDTGTDMMFSSDKIIALNKWAESKKVIPLKVTTKKQVEIFNQIDKCLGINHEWRIGDKYYVLCCPVPKSKP